MKLVSFATIEIAKSPEAVFDHATACENLPKLFRGHGPVPGVAHAEVVGGGTLKTGCTRRITSTDSSVLDETILLLERPTKQVYEIPGGFKFPLSWLVRSIHSDWTFVRAGDGTRIDWQFDATLTSVLVYPITALIVKRAMERAMRECLERLKVAVS